MNSEGEAASDADSDEVCITVHLYSVIVVIPCYIVYAAGTKYSIVL